MRKVWREVLIFAVVAVCIPLIIILLIRFTPLPPIGEMESARETLSRASRNKADTYSKKLYTEAKIFYDSAMANWERENERFIYFRNYEKVAMFAKLSATKASQAGDNSLSSKSNLKDKIDQKINSLNELIAEINDLFTTYPLTSETRNRISKGKILLKEAEILYKNGQYLLANRKITDSEYLLTSTHEDATSNLKSYFKSYPLWKKWIDLTIEESKRNHDHSIIVDKFSRKCFVYYSGRKKFEFEAELGKNWVGDKRFKGDKATPEGMYKVIKKFNGKETKYYKALLLNYPNDDDIRRFKSGIAHGSIPSSARIGGLIEIHGNGGKGIDWTEGCVALTDKEMDKLFRLVKVGTPVTIIGSMVDLVDLIGR